MNKRNIPIHSDILNSIYTEEDKALLLSALISIAGRIYTAKKLDRLVKSLPQKVYDVLWPSLAKISKENLENFIQDLEEKLHKMKVLELTVAFDPTAHFSEKVALWVKGNLGRETLVKFHKDEGILGGAQITFQGIYKDFSLRSRME